jgi:hypothetical protein
MKSSEINKAIAEICGWRNFERSGILLPDPPWLGYPTKNAIIGKKQKVPDYCGDLNAMHEAEGIVFSDLSEISTCRYWSKELPFVTGATSGWIHRDSPRIGGATATQRAEAFLRTFGKWVDEETAETADPNCTGNPR